MDKPNSNLKMLTSKSFGWRENIISIPLILGVSLLIVNQRIGFNDGGVVNLVAFFLRSELWLTLGVVLCIVLAPIYLIRLPIKSGLVRSVTSHLPIAFVLLTLFATFLSYFRYDQIFDLFGLYDILKTLLCICISRIIFGFSIKNHRFAVLLVNIFIFTSILNVFAAIFTSVTGINHIVGFNEEMAAGDTEVGLGFLSYGERFQGLSTNPNIVATQTAIALSFVIPNIIQYITNGRVIKAVIFIFYLFSLLAIILWTGVRASLLVIPLIFILALWLRVKSGLKGQVITMMYVPLVSALLALAWLVAASLGLTETVADRVSNSEDGRIFLWLHYTGLLLQNPFGMGIAFESIADTYSILDRQRLPPHNSILQTAMYSGFVGILVYFFLLRKTFRFFLRYRKNIPLGTIPINMQGTFIAWIVTVFHSLFGGLLFADFNFIILTSLLIFQIYEARCKS